MYERLASLAARELGWDTEKRRAELDALLAYGDSLRVAM